MANWPFVKRQSARAFRAAGRFAVDAVYPKRCAGCGRRGTWLCTDCDVDLTRFAPPWCARCGVPNALGVCQCDRMPDVLGATRSVGPYDGWLREAVVQFKYHGEWDRAGHLAGPLADVMADLLPCDALVPVPLHRARLRSRGFNQAMMLAEAVATMLTLEVSQALVRTRQTGAQAQMGAAQRHANVHGAFSLGQGAEVRGRRLVLIDDVITTGSTLAACAEILMQAGADAVAVATIAREL